MTTRALGIDVGLTGVRATVVDDAGHLLGSARAGSAVAVGGGRAAHDPRDWERALVAAGRDALAQAGCASVDAIAIGAVGPAPFLLDARGEPVTPALCFALDERAEQDRVALGVSGDHALPKVRHLARQHREAVRAADAAGWLVERLTGVPTLDAVSRRAWLHDGYPQPLPIPDPIAPTDVAGGLTQLAATNLGLGAGTPVLAGTYDSYVDVFASGCRTPGDGCVLLGSTLIVYGVVQLLGTDGAIARDDGLELQAYPGEGLLLGGSTASGGNVLAWIAGITGDRSAEAAALEPGAGGLLALPYVAGERTPIADAGARGALVGLSLETTPVHLYRAFVDALALAALDHHERIERATPVARYRVAGGGVHNPAWLAATADALGVPLVPAPLAGDGAGPALFALAAIGAPVPDDPTRVITPDPTRTAAYRALLPRYRALYEAVRPLQESQ